MPKYILSDEFYSFYLYSECDFPAFCAGNTFPQFYANGEWRKVYSFLEFCDNAIGISREKFLELVKEQNIPLPEEVAAAIRTDPAK